MSRALVRFVVLLGLAAAAPSAAAQGQLVPVKTVPVAAGDQFLMLPSATVGMGGVTVAVDDSLADPWSNPAQGVFVAEPALLGAPTFYSISSDGGSGRTFPVAGFFKGGRWFGGAAVALQQIENATGGNELIWIRPQPWPGGQRLLRDASSRNLYAHGFVGARLGDGPWSMGLGFSGASLDALDGVDLLYMNAESVEQSGTLGDVRVGLYRDGDRERLSLLVLHDRVSMTHDVAYVDIVWDSLGWNPTAVRRVEVNEDKTRTVGGQIAYDRDLNAPGWRFGTSVTVNRKSHPKIPNYEIQNIPRDPGTTWAYDLGLGVSRTRGPLAFALDVELQPIWSETWQEAAEDVETADGGLIRSGGRTIENDFFFTNVILRTGVSYDVGSATVQGGVEVRSYDYQLDQRDHVAVTFRDQDESWMEWSPSVGAAFRVGDVELRYAGRLTTGTGQPGILPTADALAARAEAGDFILAPQAPLTLQDATVMTHQLSARIPIR
ncbi:MAG TPA: hypothetical protein VLA36_01500 [Longimicrobiales bacterium]|nr:hypothetical protein [Longimicrobiales bacterium]